ncbi:MAG TPA: primosomal protein N' [Candidatus Saccharimonadales bacterium]|nr:primosomal protein N' [Candidatus Saccharimonadales bacterium]
MHYYEVLVGALAYHGSEALTYSSDRLLTRGQLVRVALRDRSTLGVVLRSVGKPGFAVKPISAVAPYPPLTQPSLQLMEWLRAYYPAPLGAVVRQFVPPTEIFPQPTATSTDIVTSETWSAQPLPPLGADQAAALQAIQGPGSFLLHGITGSGKSRVYVELAERALSAGTSAMVLTPEIGLTAQLTDTFRHTFGSRVYVLHSQLTAAERRNIWYELLAQTQPVIVIGPRSALFSPVHSLGLIVLDEAHDNAYKNESAPHYQAGRVAAKLAQLHKATFVLGSATPAVEDYYLATQKQRPIVAMQRLAKTTGPHVATAIEMVDMKQRELFSRSPLLSDRLLAHIADAMKRGEQSLLFLNRRGTANVVLCNQCGWQSVCPNCDLSLTYHGDEHLLRCHVCGFSASLPSSCPTCGNTDILFKSIGTKAVVAALQKLFPAARLQRFDTDAKKSERLEQHLTALAAGSADIIVGTQMIGKGLDLPQLSVVGIVNADSSLLIPDYTAAEQTYQLISQVVGRVGRGHRAGTVVVQTYDPENTTLLAAVHHRWQQFYEAELQERRLFHFPPFVYLLKLRVLRASSKTAEQAAVQFATQLKHDFPAATIEGPAPSFHPRERGKYSWQLLVKASSRQTLIDIIASLPSGWSYDIDPVNLL